MPIQRANIKISRAPQPKHKSNLSLEAHHLKPSKAFGFPDRIANMGSGPLEELPVLPPYKLDKNSSVQPSLSLPTCDQEGIRIVSPRQARLRPLRFRLRTEGNMDRYLPLLNSLHHTAFEYIELCGILQTCRRSQKLLGLAIMMFLVTGLAQGYQVIRSA